MLNKYFKIRVDYDLLYKKSRVGFYSDFWNSIKEEYPNLYGVLGFSRIGFNKKRDKALVYYSIVKGKLSGSGYVC